MIDGFWTVQFQGLPTGVASGGVVLFTKGKVFGGDSGYTYMGTYEGDDVTLKARILVQNFLPTVPNVMGQRANFELEVMGTVTGDIIKATAHLPAQPAMKLNALLTRKSNLI